MIPFIEHYQVNQLNWKGKESQKALYELTVLKLWLVAKWMWISVRLKY